MKENTDDGQVKFCFADVNRNLKIKFHDNRNLETQKMINTGEKFDYKLEMKLHSWKSKLKLLFKDQCKWEVLLW